MATIESMDEAEAAAPARRRGRPLLAGLALAALLGGGGFYASWSGLVAAPFGGDPAGAPARRALQPGDLPAFVRIGEMVIPLGPEARARFLVIEIELEARPEDAAALEALRPRILDVFNTFLRALDESDVEAPSAALKLRAQLLRRARAVAAPVEPRDLLITAFVLK